MATASEIRKVLAVLTTYYPYWQREQTETQLNATYGLYEQMLEDVSAVVLEAAALAHVTESRFFPTIAELRDQAIALMVPEYPTALEAWHARSDRTNPISNRLLQMLPDYNDRMVTLKEQAMIRAQFVKTYNEIVAREKRERRLLPGVRKLRAQLQADHYAALEHAGKKL